MACWISRSCTVGIPNCLTPPSGLGISTCLTGLGRYFPLSRASRTSNQCAFRWPRSSFTPILSIPAAPLLLSTRFNAVSMFPRSNIASHVGFDGLNPSPASDFPLSRAGNGSALCAIPAGFTCFACSVVSLSGNFCLPGSFRELLIVLILSSFGPSLIFPVLWPRLTPVVSVCLRKQGCLPAWQQVSPGKNIGFPCTLAAFTLPALDRIGLRCSLPTRPAGLASHSVRVPQVAGLLPASFRPHLAMTPLPSANGWCNQPPSGSFTR